MKKILSVILCVVIIFAASVSAFGLEIDYPYNGVNNNGKAGGVTITVSHPDADEVFSVAHGGLNHEWYTTDVNGVHEIFIWADEDTDIGTNSVSLVWLDGATNKMCSETVFVDVFDASKPKIQKATQNGKNVKITWNGAKSNYYDIQYRVKNGSWKTVASEYSVEETGMKYTFKNLKKGKTYQFRVRPVTPTYQWGTRYGQWSTAVSVKVK